jgi:hypothetical protein
MSIQADVRASTEGLPGGRKQSRSRTRMSMPSAHWTPVLHDSTRREGREGAMPSARRSCSAVVPGYRAGSRVAQGQPLIEVSNEISGRRGSHESDAVSDQKRASSMGAQGAASSQQTSCLSPVRSSAESPVNSKPTLSGEGASRRSCQAALPASERRGRRASALPRVPLSSVTTSRRQELTAHAASTRLSSDQPLSSCVSKPVCFLNMGSRTSSGCVITPQADSMKEQPVLEPCSDFCEGAEVGQENCWPTTVSPANKQEVSCPPLTEIQQMMQSYDTSLPWADHLDGHDVIAAGRRAVLGVGDRSTRVQKKKAPSRTARTSFQV